MNKIYIFNCPYHGEERHVLCWRAFQQENINLWQKYRVTYEQQDLPKDEVLAYIEGLKKATLVSSVLPDNALATELLPSEDTDHSKPDK